MKDTLKHASELFNGCAVWIIEHNAFGWLVIGLMLLAILASAGVAGVQYNYEAEVAVREADWYEKYDGVQRSIDSLRDDVLVNRTLLNAKFEIIEKLLTK